MNVIGQAGHANVPCRHGQSMIESLTETHRPTLRGADWKPHPGNYQGAVAFNCHGHLCMADIALD